MRILFVGDIVGRPGRDIALEKLPFLKSHLNLDWIIVNAENAAGGFGITEEICHDLYDVGTDVITTGNHVWDQKEILTYIDTDDRLLRPLNFPEGTPGRGLNVFKKDGVKDLLVTNVMTRLFMDALDDPFSTLKNNLAFFALGQDNIGAIVVDVHGEANSEKMALGHFLDGKVSLVVGTHTHIPTADAQIFPMGTAYQTDAGMTGDYDSVIGMEKKGATLRFTRKIYDVRLTPAKGPGTLCGVFVETNDETGLAVKVKPIRIGARLENTF